MLGSALFKRMGSAASGGGGGGGSGLVDLRARTIEADFNDPSWKIDNDGFTYVFPGPVQDLSWIEPQSGMSLYDVRATWLSGDVPTGEALSTWLNMGVDHTWNWTGTVTSRMNIEIRLASTGSIVDSAIIKFHVPFVGGGGGGATP